MNKVILKGLNLFAARTQELSKVDVKNFEKYYKTPIPSIYRLFISSFKIGRNFIKSVKVHHPDSGELCIHDMKYSGKYSEYIGLEDLFSLSESIMAMKNAYDINDEIHRMGYSVIGNCSGSNINLFLGIGGENNDKIFLENSTIFPNGNRLILISDNIFEFANNLMLCEREQIGYGIKSYDQLYKNWGEIFWRIREEKYSS